jgi:hypothetical protein
VENAPSMHKNQKYAHIMRFESIKGRAGLSIIRLENPA